MKLFKTIMLAAVFVCAITGIAAAAGTVNKGQTVTVSANVKNGTSRYLKAAVKMKAYDGAGGEVGRLCREVYLAAGKTTTVSYLWQAPGYATGLYWSPQVEINGSCLNAGGGTYVVYDDDDEHDGDHDDHDDDDHDDDDHDDDDDDHDDDDGRHH